MRLAWSSFVVFGMASSALAQSRDPAGAEVAVPGWPTFRSPQVELNYATMTLRAPRLRAVQTAPKPPADVEAQER